MGGPCNVDGQTGPPCTNNFQSGFPFKFEGCEWQSVEQAFQAMKYSSEEKRARILAIPVGPEHGAQAARAGQERLPIRPDWDAVRHIIMYRIVRCKYQQHQTLQAELLATGDKAISHPDANPFWATWNAAIHTRCRAEFKGDSAIVTQSTKEFEDFSAAELARLKVEMSTLPGEVEFTAPLPPPPPHTEDISEGQQAELLKVSSGSTPKAQTARSLGQPSGDWFFDLFGFREVAYEATKEKLKVLREEGVDGLLLQGVHDHERYKVGRFSTPNILELQVAAEKLGGKAARPGKICVKNVLGDVAAKHGESANRHATFQVASQFNCLEFVGPNVTPERGITGYEHDRTQGPACSIACGPATAYRNYFAEVDGQEGQRRDRQLNCLRHVISKIGNEGDKYFRVTGGYTLATDEGLQQLNDAIEALSPEEYSAIVNSLCIGVHEDVQVTATCWGNHAITDPEQTVTQVFGSACSVSYSGNAARLWAPFARLVLQASYKATLWATLLAALRHGGKDGSRRVFLTCLGGGVFGNEMDWITQAMEAAVEEFENTDLEICIVTFAGSFDPRLVRLQKRFPGEGGGKGSSGGYVA